jgi:apolipoprotein N-acyltransferase
MPLLSALLLFAGMPGQWSCWPLLFIALVPLFLAIIKSPTKKQVLVRAIVFSLVYYLLLLYWIIIVLVRYGGLPVFLAVPALFLLAAYMSLYPVSVALLMRGVAEKSGHVFLLLFVPTLWVGFDWLRSFLFSGFPWMDMGYGLWQETYLIQLASVFGHHGITFCLVFSNIVLTLVFHYRREYRIRVYAAAALAVLVVVLPGYSFLCLKSGEKRVDVTYSAEIGAVQGNILQDQKWSEDLKEKTVGKYLHLSQSIDDFSHLDLIVWPETALPFYPAIAPEFGAVVRFLEQKHIPILTGSPWYEVVESDKPEYRYYNSAILLGSDRRLLGRYNKSHLVPYGEYVPLKEYMGFIQPLVETVGDFTPGKVETPLAVGKVRAGILLCYESIFPDIARKWVNQKANVLVNLTNDAWYGKSSAPYQSFGMTVFRAVETGRSVVRAANTGISGVVDPFGRVVVMSDIFVPWAGKARVPLSEYITFFVRLGWLFGPVCFFMAVLLSVKVLLVKKGKVLH